MKPEEDQQLGFAEKVALFVTAKHKEQATTLFEGLAPRERERALEFSTRVRTWDSARRHARLAWEFGVKPDAEDRLEVVVGGVSGALRDAVVALIPPTMRSRFQQRQGGEESVPDLVWGLASRLIREVSR